MATADDVRELALALPETTEKLAWDQPTFRVRDKIFVSLSGDETSMGFMVDKEERAGLLESDPAKFFINPSHDANFNFARLHLAAVDRAELAELIEDAWRYRAPVRLARAYDEGSAERESR